MRASVFLSILVASLTAACATVRSGALPQSGGVRSSQIVTAEQFDPRVMATAYQVVTNLRPEFLRPRGPRLPGAGVLVYLNGVRLGGIEHLHHISTANVAEIRYLTESQATFQFGTRDPGAAILIVLGTRRPKAQ